MKIENRKRLLAGAIATFITLPAWAGSDQMTATESESAVESAETSASSMEPLVQPSKTEDTLTIEPVSRNDAEGRLLTLTPDDLYQRDVMGRSGEKIGHITDVVSDKQTGDVYAVISTGGFLGVIGGSKHVIPLMELEISNQQVYLDATEDQLQARDLYADDRYVVVEPHDQPISEFSAFETTQ